MKEINIDKLRSLVRNYLERHHYDAAVFWGDKVVTLSCGDPVDVYWLAQAYISTQQYHRACLLINTHNLTRNGSLCYLCALCHYKVQEYKEALLLLESPSWPVDSATGDPGTSTDCSAAGCGARPIPQVDDVVALECSRQLLRARVYEAMDNPGLATECYQSALVADPMCYDALKSLTDHHMLSIQEERDLHESLPLATRCDSQQQADFVRLCYQTKLNKCAVDEMAVTAKSDKSPALPEVNRVAVDIDNLPAPLSILSGNLDILTARAERLYYKCNFVSCFQLTRTVLEQDPYHSECLPLHIACLIELQQSNALFLLAHKLVDLYPETALAWFAVGSYYYLIGKNEHARRYLSKATSIDKAFGPAWIAFAHSFASESEHDQASAAYFKAAQLMRGSHLPLLYIGMEYSLTNNPKFAEKFFQKAIEMAPEDPFVLHELGVVHFHNQQYARAEVYLRRAMSVVQRLYNEDNNYYNIPAKWTALMNNLGHALRKQGKCREALHYHHQAVRLLPSEACTLTSIALCHALLGENEEAVEALHSSLALQRDQPVASTLLSTLLDTMAAQDAPFPDEEDVTLPNYTNIMGRIARAGASRDGAAGSCSSALEQQPAGAHTAGQLRSPAAAAAVPVTAEYNVSEVLGDASTSPANTTARSLMSMEDMVMDDDSD